MDVLRLNHNALLCFLVFFLLSFTSVPIVLAHAPLGSGDNESLETASIIPDPTKSWAIYTSLSSDGHPQYFTFNISAGQTIKVMLYKSTQSQDTDFTPRLVLIGPNLTASGEVPSEVTVPPNNTASLVESNAGEPTFEPFSPGTLVNLAAITIDNPAPGQYWLVVYEQSEPPQGGNYGLAIGERETFTLDEWILIPFNLVGIYQWQGQSLALILAPMIVSVAVGVVFTAWVLYGQRRLYSPLAWLAAVAGFSFIGTAASTFMQLAIDATVVNVGVEALLTFIFAVIPLSLGVLTVRLALQNKPITLRHRVYLVVLGVAALFIWSGYIVGPALAIAASVMPSVLHRRRH
jgi:hypothetical protein